MAGTGDWRNSSGLFMQPLTIILGIVFGSVFSVAVSLATVLLVFGLRTGEDSRYVLEIPELWRAVVMFSLAAVVAGLAFLGSLRAAPWRLVADHGHVSCPDRHRLRSLASLKAEYSSIGR